MKVIVSILLLIISLHLAAQQSVYQNELKRWEFNLFYYALGVFDDDIRDIFEYVEPISIGADVNYQILHKLSINPGIIVSHNNERSQNYFSKITWLTIPLNLKYYFTERRMISAYTAGGFSYNYISEAFDVDWSSQREIIIYNQFSYVTVNWVFGTDIKLSPHIGIRVEPGISSIPLSDTLIWLMKIGFTYYL